jgi:hypothetical protein
MLLFTLSGLISLAQMKTDAVDTRSKNNINVNLFGDASAISINYERLFLISSHCFITGKIGIGYNEEFKLTIWGPTSPPEKYLTLPFHITGNLGKGRHFFEFGLGETIINGKTNQHFWFYPIVGYRLQPLRSKKANFRFACSIPFYNSNKSETIIFIPIGFNVGISF